MALFNYRVFSTAEVPSIEVFLGVTIVWVLLNTSLLLRSYGTDNLADVNLWCVIVSYWFILSFRLTLELRACIIMASFQISTSVMVMWFRWFERERRPVLGLCLSATYSSFSVGEVLAARSSKVTVGWRPTDLDLWWNEFRAGLL